MASLIEIQAQANDAVALLAAIDPDDTDSLALLEEQITALAQDAAAKVDQWYAFLKRMEAESGLNREVAQEHAARAQAIDNFIDRLKKRLVEANAVGILPEKMEGRTKAIRFQNNSQPSVTVDPEVSLAELECSREWHRFVRTTLEIDKKAVIEAAKAGEPLPPGITVHTGRHVRFTIKRSK